MFPANLLLLMVLLLPQGSSGRQAAPTSSQPHHSRGPPPSPTAPPPEPRGLAQTVPDLLLTRLGLQSQPDPRPGVPVPQYLLDLYRFHSQQYHLVEDPAFSFPARHVEQANTVRSFHHTESLDERAASPDRRKRLRLSFNVSSIPGDEQVVSAELRLLRHDDSSLGLGAHRLSLYLSEDQGDPRPTLLDTRLLPSGAHRSGGDWEAIGLGAELLQGALSRTGSLDLLVEVTLEDDDTNTSSSSSSSSSSPRDLPHLLDSLGEVEGGRHREARLRVRRSLGQDEHSWARERPLLVTYSHDGRGQPLAAQGRRLSGGGQGARGGERKGSKDRGRSSSTGRNKGGRTRGRVRGKGTYPGPGWGVDGAALGWGDWGRVKRNGGRAAKLKRLSRARCRRHPLYVDFNEVGWHKWIIAPSGYDAFFCLGECRFPLADHMNSSSHAMVQTLVNSVNGAVPRACCVPTSLSPIALLYLDPQDRVVLKNYQDMVVEGCGCR